MKNTFSPSAKPQTGHSIKTIPRPSRAFDFSTVSLFLNIKKQHDKTLENRGEDKVQEMD